MTCSRRIIETIKVIARVEGLEANNALTLDPLTGVLQFGGPLIKDTIVNGNYNLSFGSFGSNIKYFSVSSNTTVYLEASNGVVGSFINIENNRILIGSSSPGSGGLMGLHNYTAGMTDGRYYVQKMYVDNYITGHPASNAVTQPGPTEDQKMIAWNNATSEWIMRTGSGAVTVGQPTEVIWNDAGTLVGHPNFTFTTASNFLSVPSISLGHAFLDGIYRHLYAQGAEANISIVITTKAMGSLVLGVYTGAILLGGDNSPNTVQRLMARGAGPQVDIALETKGPDGIVYIGDKDEIGAFRRIAPRGYNATVNMMIQSKGAGNVILEPDPSNSYDHAWVKIGHGSGSIPGIRTRRLYADSDWVTTNLELGGSGLGHTLLLGISSQLAATRFLTVASYYADCNLEVYGKGLGKVAVNNIVRSKKVAIVNWNMLSLMSSFLLPHGLPDWKKIVSVEIIIRSDADSNYGPLSRMRNDNVIQGGVEVIDPTYIRLWRCYGGEFQQSMYSATGGYVRGWAWINYEL